MSDERLSSQSSSDSDAAKKGCDVWTQYSRFATRDDFPEGPKGVGLPFAKRFGDKVGPRFFYEN